MLLSFHKFPSFCGRTPAASPDSPWLLPKFANSQIVAEIIENNQNAAESTQNRSIQLLSHPLSAAKKPDAQGLVGAAGSGLVAICRKRGVGRAKKTRFFKGLGARKVGERFGSGPQLPQF